MLLCTSVWWLSGWLSAVPTADAGCSAGSGGSWDDARPSTWVLAGSGCPHDSFAAASCCCIRLYSSWLLLTGSMGMLLPCKESMLS